MRLYDRKSLIFLSSSDGEYACTMYQCFARFYYFIRTDNHSSKTNPKADPSRNLSLGLPFQNKHIVINHR
jgi:hypothetical protein